LSKLAWVLLPAVLYLGYLLVARLLNGTMPNRRQLNVQLSLLLMLYLLATAGLGIFWVANQQLPVFDWHYLFGYGTVILVLIHLFFNLPKALRMLRAPPRMPGSGNAEAANSTVANSGAANSSTWLRKWRKPALAVALLAAIAGAYQLGANQRAAAPSAMATSSRGVEAILRFHEFSSESRRDIFARAPSIDWGNAPPDFKTYAKVGHINLPRGDNGQRSLSASLRSAQTREHALQLTELGDLLYLAAGITKRQTAGRALRASPSSGALFSGELYVLVRSVQGLAPGVYHYDPEHDRLDVLGPLPSGDADKADATVVLTSVVRRTAYKYHDRAYRYMTADGGHLLENLRVASQSIGMQAKLSVQFDEHALAQALGVDGVEEIVLASMALNRSASMALPAQASHAGQFVPAQPAAAPATGAPGATGVTGVTGATGIVHQATSLRLSALATDAIQLPAPQATTATVNKVITERRSKRRFTEDAVSLDALSSILADMRQEHQLSTAIRINLVVNRVQGLAPGVYRYDPRHTLTLVRRGDFGAAAGEAALAQDVIGDAAVVLVLSAAREPMLAEGPRGYRHGFLEAGLIGERWLLGAVARQLGACPVGAFYDDEAAALIGVDPQREWVLHFAALGVPAAE
jgi:SagB-type dehydrogenase family enzyme